MGIPIMMKGDQSMHVYQPGQLRYYYNNKQAATYIYIIVITDAA